MSVDPETLAVYDENATHYADTFQSTSPGGLLRRFMALLPPGAAVLDLGCGPGQSSVFMKDAGFQVTATDPSSGMIDVARAAGVDARLGAFQDLDEQQAYHGIWCNFALLHADRDAVPRYLQAMHRALRPGGFLHVAVKQGEGTDRDRLGRRYTFFQINELNGLLADAGFETLDHETGSEVGMAGTNDPWFALRARACVDA